MFLLRATGTKGDCLPCAGRAGSDKEAAMGVMLGFIRDLAALGALLTTMYVWMVLGVALGA